MTLARPGKKRGRDISPEEKLRHQSSKLISRETKKIRAFILQRLVKKCRKLRGGKEGEEGEEGAQDAKASEQEAAGPVKKVLEEIQAVKALSTDAVIAVCMRKLGIKPSKAEEAAVEGAGKEAAVGGEGDDKSDDEDEEEEEETGLLMQFVNHPRMKELLKEITAKMNRPEKKKKQSAADKKAERRKESNGPYNPYTSNGRELKRGPRVSHEGNKAVFVDSLSGRVERPAPGDDGEDDDMDIYGYKSCVPQARKNRPGQRARRAKVEAENYRQSGSAGAYTSLNVRKKRPPEAGQDGGRQGDDKKHRGEAPGSRGEASGGAGAGAGGMEQLHPSWAAKKALKKQEGIVQFAGKKITFADD